MEGFFYLTLQKMNITPIILFLNDIGTSEVVFILIAVLLLFGSKGLPSIAKNLGRGMREIKTATDEIKQDIQQSAVEMKRNMNMPDLELEKIKKPIETLKNPIKEISKSIIDTSKDVDNIEESLQTDITNKG